MVASELSERSDPLKLQHLLSPLVELLWMRITYEGANERADHSTAVAVVAANKGIGGDGGIKVIVILPREVECGGEGVVNVAGRAELAADNDAVVLASPCGGPLGREPVPGRMHHGLAQWDILREINKQTSEAISGAKHIAVPVRQGHVALHGLSDLFSIEAAVLPLAGEGRD